MRHVSAVLIVGDDTITQRFLRTTLGVWNCDVLSATAVSEAQDTLMKLPFSLVILDITVPGPDGFNSISLIREVTETPVIVLGTRPTARDRNTALRLGAHGYLVKPFGVADLKSAVCGVLCSRSGA